MSEEQHYSYITFQKDFSTFYLYEKSLIYSDWNIKTELILNTLDETLFNKYMIKLNYFFDAKINDSIMINCENEWALETFCDIDNNIVLLPGQPNYSTFSLVLKSKMSAICKNDLEVGEIELFTDNNLNITYGIYGNVKPILPTMENWTGSHNHVSVPWWDRNDASTLDLPVTKDADISKPPSYAESFDFLFTTDIINENVDADRGKILNYEFRPKIIKNEEH